MPTADVLYSCDSKWWHYHQEALGFRGLKVCLDDSVIFPEVKVLMTRRSYGFDDDPSFIADGGNSGYQAVHLAAHFGAARIILLGYDMHGGHFFGKHPEQLQSEEIPFSSFIHNFRSLAPQLASRQIEVLNCTPGSALDCFGATIDLDAALV